MKNLFYCLTTTPAGDLYPERERIFEGIKAFPHPLLSEKMVIMKSYSTSSLLLLVRAARDDFADVQKQSQNIQKEKSEEHIIIIIAAAMMTHDTKRMALMSNTAAHLTQPHNKNRQMMDHSDRDSDLEPIMGLPTNESMEFVRMGSLRRES